MSEYTAIILLALFGFIALAFVLLFPVYVFLKREEKASEQWTEEALHQRWLAQKDNDSLAEES